MREGVIIFIPLIIPTLLISKSLFSPSRPLKRGLKDVLISYTKAYSSLRDLTIFPHHFPGVQFYHSACLQTFPHSFSLPSSFHFPRAVHHLFPYPFFSISSKEKILETRKSKKAFITHTFLSRQFPNSLISSH